MDDRGKRRLPSVMGDDERARVGADRRAIPVAIDAELTPVTQATYQALDRLSGKVDALVQDVAEVRAKVYEFLDPAVARSLMPRMDSVERSAQRTEIEQRPLVVAVEKLADTLDKLERRFDRFERDIERLLDADKMLGTRIDGQAEAFATLTTRVAALELVRVEQLASEKAVTALTTTQKAKRGALWAALVAVGGVAVELVKWAVGR